MVIERIVTLWTMGATAKETVAALRNENIKIGLQTVYRLRRGLTATELIDELMRLQMRAIAECPNLALQLKYGDRLLGKLMKQDAKRKTGSAQNWKMEMIKKKTKVKKRPPGNPSASDNNEYVRQLLTK
jgi:hypothetical protein